MRSDETLDLPKIFLALSLWIGKTIVLLLSSAVSFETFVLGNDRVSGAMAAVFVALLLTITSFTCYGVAKKLGITLNNARFKKLFLFGEASAILWFAKLFSLSTGFGISNILVVFIVSAVVILIDEPIFKLIKKVNLEG